MATLELHGLDELNNAFSRISDIPWSVTEDALAGMAAVASEKIKAEGESMGVRDPQSDVHILDSLYTKKAKQTPAGGYRMISFRGSRTRGGKRRPPRKTRNAEIAFINEFGKRGQKGRPFIGNALAKNADAIAKPAEKIVGDWIEYEYMK